MERAGHVFIWMLEAVIAQKVTSMLSLRVWTNTGSRIDVDPTKGERIDWSLNTC